MEDHKTTFTLSRALRDQIWQFVSALVGALAILAAYHVFFLQQEVKALQVVILASTSLIEVERSVAEEIKVLYKDQLVADFSLFQVKVENSGNQPIREEDYVKPIKFIFPPQAEIVEAVILESSPPDIGMTVQTERSSATLSPVLLNEEDRAIVRLLVSNMPAGGDAQPFDIEGRIAGLKEVHIVSAIEERKTIEGTPTTLAWWLGGPLAVLGGFLMAGILGFVLQKRRVAKAKAGEYRRPQSVT